MSTLSPKLLRVLMPFLAAMRGAILRVESRFDALYLASDVPSAGDWGHSSWRSALLAIANKPGLRVLEIGSRKVTQDAPMRVQFDKAEYVGFDFNPGENVDVVGDAHQLSSYFGEGEKFDLIFSSAVFEHLAMPWVVAEEISRMLRVGGHVFVETHFSFSSHERPWHFFQFSDMALRVLFPPALGFECLAAGMSNPLVGRFSSMADPYLRHRPVTGLYCHSELLARKVKDVGGVRWGDLMTAEVVNGTTYPQDAQGQN